jgi:hypothetical protein
MPKYKKGQVAPEANSPYARNIEFDPRRPVNRLYLTAADRKASHKSDPKRKAHDETSLKSYLKKHNVDGHIKEHVTGTLRIAAGSKSHARNFAYILNKFSYLADRGYVASSEDNDVLIEQDDYCIIMRKLFDDIMKPAEFVFTRETIEAKRSSKQLTVTEREAYHEQNPARKARHCNALKNKLFTAQPVKPEGEVLTFRVFKASDLEDLVKSLNAFSYVVKKEKVACLCRATATLQIRADDYEGIKVYVQAIPVVEKRKPKMSCEQRAEYHQTHPDRKKSDFACARRLLPLFNLQKNSYEKTFPSTDATSNAYGVIQRCSYLVKQDSVANKEGGKVSIDKESYEALRPHFM